MQDISGYKLALIVTGYFQVAFIVLGLVMRQDHVRGNRQLDEGKVEYGGNGIEYGMSLRHITRREAGSRCPFCPLERLK